MKAMAETPAAPPPPPEPDLTEDGLVADKKYSEQLMALQEVSLELARLDDLDELRRQAVELGASRLGFERLGLWMIDPLDANYMLGAFGIDENGCLRDERHRRVRVPERSALERLVAKGLYFIYLENAILYDDRREPVGLGNKAMAALWDGQQIIGVFSADNLLTHQPITQRQLNLLDVFARSVGHLLTLKRTQQALRRANRALRTLTECNQHISRADSEAGLIDGLCRLLVAAGGYGQSAMTLSGAPQAPDLTVTAGTGAADWQAAVAAVARTGQACLTRTATAATAAVPLPLDPPAVGCLYLWAAEPDRFDAQEVGLLTELASDIAYGLQTLRLRAEQQRAAASIRQLNEALERRVAERTADLETANRELEAFSYSISHDLRAPLRAIDGYSQVLLEEHAAVLPAEGQDYLRRIRIAAERMSEQFDALLALSRLLRDELQRTTVDLSALAGEIVAELRQQCPERAVAAVIAEGLTAHGDPRLVRAVLENLLGNAWKFTARTPAAQLEVGGSGAAPTVFFVRDNGVGFDMAYANKLFRTFERLHAPTEFPGHGIGLAIVARIVRRHGGRVWADSRVNEGATFYFTLEAPPK